MRRSVFKFLAVAAVAAVALASPASAKDTRLINSKPPSVFVPPAVVSACDPALVSANACSGYYADNLIGGSPDKIEAQIYGVSQLPGTFEWNGDWDSINKITSLSGPQGDQMNFGTTLFGITIIGAHFGNVAGPAGNVSVFWLFDFGTTGANFVTLADTGGWSNAALYTTGTPPSVPEPATWAMMLLGFGAAGAAMRRSRRQNSMLAQIA